MPQLPNLPAISADPNASIEFRAMECRTCGDMGPAVDTSDKQNTDHLWDAHHAEGTGHHDFYAWTLTRNVAWTGTIGGLRRGSKGRRS